MDTDGRLPELRLQIIEKAALQSGRFGDRLTIELVDETRRLRQRLTEYSGRIDGT